MRCARLWAESASSPTWWPTRSRPEKWWSGRRAWSRSCSKIRLTPARPNFAWTSKSGGRRLIRLADDGSGMMRDDALLAFERHATSKLSDVKDLLSISTLGFRGEALPSIASVSRLLLETRAAEERVGHRGRDRRRKDSALRRSRARGGNHDHGARSVLQRPGAQEIPAVGSDGDRAHRVAGDALQPGASVEEFSAAAQQRGTAER